MIALRRSLPKLRRVLPPRSRRTRLKARRPFYRLRDNSELQAITQGVAWEPYGLSPALRRIAGADQEIGLGMELHLATPISSTGPWLMVRCRGSRQVWQDAKYDEVQSLNVIVGHDGSLLQVMPESKASAPGTEPKYDPSHLRAWALFELPSGKELVRTDPGQTLDRKFVECPKGFNDD